MSRLGGIERFRRGTRRALAHHEVRSRRNAIGKSRYLVVHHHVTGGTKCFAQRHNILALRIGDEQLDMKRMHQEKLVACRYHYSMAQLLDIPALAPGDEIHHTLLVVEVSAKGGDHPRTNLVFGNRTGRIASAPFWSGSDEMIRGIAKGMLVQVVGKVTTYKETNQLTTSSVRALPKGTVPLADLVPSVGPVDKYWQYLDDTRGKLTAPRLRAVLDLFYGDGAFREAYEQCPGAPGTGHHATLGGLLQHTCEVLRIGQQIARVARADEELVVAGALLHDIGKTECYTWETGVFDTNERGRLIGHVVQGAIMLERALGRTSTPLCTPEEQMLLAHFVLSHHGLLEHGAPVKPLTLEAEILHFADDASAKTASIADAYASKELFPDGARVSSKRVWQLDNRWMFKARMDFGRPAS